MVKIRKEKETSLYVVYLYFPEGGEEFGVLRINKVSGEIEVEKRAKKEELNSYMFHAMQKLREYYKNNEYLERDIVAWY